MLDKNTILDCDDFDRKEVYIKEWGGSVLIKSLNVGDEIELDLLKEKGASNTDIVFFLIMRSVIDENNNLLFINDEDLTKLKQKSSSTITKLYKEIIELNNKIDNQAENEAKN